MTHQGVKVAERMGSAQAPQSKNHVVEPDHFWCLQASRSGIETMLPVRQRAHVNTILRKFVLETSYRGAFSKDVLLTVNAALAEVADMLTIDPFHETQSAVRGYGIEM